MHHAAGADLPQRGRAIGAHLAGRGDNPRHRRVAPSKPHDLGGGQLQLVVHHHPGRAQDPLRHIGLQLGLIGENRDPAAIAQRDRPFDGQAVGHSVIGQPRCCQSAALIEDLNRAFCHQETVTFDSQRIGHQRRLILGAGHGAGQCGQHKNRHHQKNAPHVSHPPDVTRG